MNSVVVINIGNAMKTNTQSPYKGLQMTTEEKMNVPFTYDKKDILYYNEECTNTFDKLIV